MSNSEHLIENAIVCLRDKKEFKDFSESKINIDMVKESFKDCDINNVLSQIWEMANEVCYSWFYNETFEQQAKK
jgi:hypothetical protein